MRIEIACDGRGCWFNFLQTESSAEKLEQAFIKSRSRKSIVKLVNSTIYTHSRSNPSSSRCPLKNNLKADLKWKHFRFSLNAKNQNKSAAAQAGVWVNNEISFTIYGLWQRKAYFLCAFVPFTDRIPLLISASFGKGIRKFCHFDSLFYWQQDFLFWLPENSSLSLLLLRA